MSYKDDRKRERDDRRGDRRRDRSRDERRDDRRDRRDERRRDDRSRRPSPSPRPKKSVGQGTRNLRIDRHECRKSAIEFLIRNVDITDNYTNEEIEDKIDDYIRTLEMEYEYYGFTVEILKSLLVDRKYTVITDRWVMGILDEHLQAELGVADLTILRVAGFELLLHPEIPHTVIIGEVNVLAKMYCPEKQSLLHAAANRMIETLTSLGNELAVESGEGRKRTRDDPMNLLIGLDQESQLALLLLEQRRRKKKQRKSPSPSPSPSAKRTRPSSPDTNQRQDSSRQSYDKPRPAGLQISYISPAQ